MGLSAVFVDDLEVSANSSHPFPSCFTHTCSSDGILWPLDSKGQHTPPVKVFFWLPAGHMQPIELLFFLMIHIFLKMYLLERKGGRG